MKVLNKKKKICEQCGSENLKDRRATYPLKVGNRDVEVQRVSIRECIDCHAFMPTEVVLSRLCRAVEERCGMSDAWRDYAMRSAKLLKENGEAFCPMICPF